MAAFSIRKIRCNKLSDSLSYLIFFGRIAILIGSALVVDVVSIYPIPSVKATVLNLVKSNH